MGDLTIGIADILGVDKSYLKEGDKVIVEGGKITRVTINDGGSGDSTGGTNQGVNVGTGGYSHEGIYGSGICRVHNYINGQLAFYTWQAC